jgi:hypothetical protein
MESPRNQAFFRSLFSPRGNAIFQTDRYENPRRAPAIGPANRHCKIIFRYAVENDSPRSITVQNRQ